MALGSREVRGEKIHAPRAPKGLEREVNVPRSAKKLPQALLGPVRMLPKVGCAGIPGISCIYRITCTALGQHYIGQTTDAARRWLEHQEQLHAGTHGNPAMQAAFARWGPVAFTFAILERLPRRYDETTFSLAEQRWMDCHRDLNPGHASLFNVRLAGSNHWLRSTEAGKKAVQAAAKGKPRDKHKQTRFHL